MNPWCPEGQRRVKLSFETIDTIRSVSDMRKALTLLDEPLRVRVIGHALKCSRFQFTWSWLADTFGADEKQHPRAVVPCGSCGGDGLSRSTPHACRHCNGRGTE